MAAEEPREPVDIPIEDVLDLHSVPPRDIEPVVEAYLEAVRARGFRALRIIHGKGIGVQRDTVRRVLARTPGVVAFGDAPTEAGGWGATVVSLGEPPPGLRAQLESEVEAVLGETQRLCRGLGTAQFYWRRRAGRWSIGECFEHLNSTHRRFASDIEEAIAGGRAGKLYGRPPFLYPPWQRWLLWLAGPPVRWRLRSPGEFLPAGQGEPAAVLAEFERLHRGLLELAQAADGLDLARIRVAVPSARRLRISLGVAFAILLAHDRRHLWQARRLRAASAFPAPGADTLEP